MSFSNHKNTGFDLLEHEALVFSFDVDGKIWKMAFDSHVGNLAFELRNEDTFDVSYLILHIEELTLSDVITFSEVDWWTSIIELNGSFLICEKYNDAQNPVDKSVAIFDFDKKEFVEQVDDFQLIEIQDNALVGERILKNREEVKHELSGVKVFTPTFTIDYPIYFDNGHPHFELASQLLNTKTLCFGVEYMESHTSLVLCYYEQSGAHYQRSLLVIQNEEEFYHEIIDSEIKGFAAGGFFKINDYLLFIKNQRQLNAINI